MKGLCERVGGWLMCDRERRCDLNICLRESGWDMSVLCEEGWVGCRGCV